MSPEPEETRLFGRECPVESQFWPERGMYGKLGCCVSRRLGKESDLN